MNDSDVEVEGIDSGHILVQISHGGDLTDNLYVGGDSKLFQIEVKNLSYIELFDCVMESWSPKAKDFLMYYLIPGKRLCPDSLVMLLNDNSVENMMAKIGQNFKRILKLYTLPNSWEAQPISDEEAQPNSDEEAQPKDSAYSGSSSGSGSETDGSYEDEGIIGLGSDTDDDEWKESVEVIRKVNKEETLSKKNVVKNLLKDSVDKQKEGKSVEVQEVVQHEETYSSYEDSDVDMNSPGESEDDDIRGKKHKVDVPIVDDQTDWNKFCWVVGTRFPTRDSFKDAIRKYAVARGRNLTISVSDKKRHGRLGVTCEEGCPFKVYLSYHPTKCCYMVKTARNKHTCQRKMSKNRQLTADFIANDFLPIFKAKPHWPAKEIQSAVKEKFKMLISKWMAYNAKSCAHKKLHGSMMEHYGKLGSYLEALKHANPSSIFELVTIPPGFHGSDAIVEQFFRIFICFDGIKKGFLAGCRKVLCLDGCFLKTFLGGMLLAAIGRDANNQMYPVAWAVVEGENNDSWTWFMNELKKCLGVTQEGKGWTLISDQQKGLLNAVALVWPDAEHRNCARHIYANWHKKFKGDDLKGVFWKAARAYSVADHKKAIEEMQELDADATKAFLDQNPKCFCKCYLPTSSKCDVIVNNMAETFNGYIIQSRSKHIINMLEDIRVALMTRLRKMQIQMSSKTVVVCPRIQQKLDRNKDWAYKCDVYPSSATVFQVKDLDDVSVDRPMNPPPIKVQSGRPKKNRKKDPHEDPKRPGNLSKHGMLMSCSVCKKRGHNKRKCTELGKTSAESKQAKRPRGRPKKCAVTEEATQMTQQSSQAPQATQMTHQSSQAPQATQMTHQSSQAPQATQMTQQSQSRQIPEGSKATGTSNRPSKAVSKPVGKAVSKPVSKAVAKPVSKAVAKPVSKPASKHVAKPGAK